MSTWRPQIGISPNTEKLNFILKWSWNFILNENTILYFKYVRVK